MNDGILSLAIQLYFWKWIQAPGHVGMGKVVVFQLCIYTEE